MEWGSLPPEINSSRLWTGPGSASIMAAGGALDALAATLTGTGTAGTAVNTAQAMSWAGITGGLAAASQVPHLAWEPAVSGLIGAASAQIKLTGEAFEEARLATPTPGEIAANQAEHVGLQAANVPALGMLTPLILQNRGQYFGDYWVRSATNMYGYMAKSMGALGGLEFPPPPPPSTLGGSLPGPMDSGESALDSSTGGMSRLSSVFEQGMSAAQPITGLPQQMAQMVGSMPQQFAQPVMSALQQVTSMTGSSFGNGAGPGNWAMSPPTGAGPVGAQFGPSGPGTGAGGGGGIGAGLRTPGAWSSAGGGAGAGSSPSVSSQTAEETGASKFGAARGANAAAGGSGGGPAMMAPLARRNKRDEAAQRSPAWAAAEDILYREPEHVPVVWGGSGAQPHRGGEE